MQRITKYQLLLKEMLKYTGAADGSEQLENALDSILCVLKYVNDVMHQIAITGFDVSVEVKKLIQCLYERKTLIIKYVENIIYF